jgi:hypothetical protein
MKTRKKLYTIQENSKSGRYHITIPKGHIDGLSLSKGDRVKWKIYEVREDEVTFKLFVKRE